MQSIRFSHFLSTSALILALSAVSGCSTLENTYDSAYDGMFGSDTASTPKMGVKSPAAAPVQDVKADDLNTQPVEPAVELGSMSDKPIESPQATAMATPPETTAAAETPVATSQPAVTETPQAAPAAIQEQPAPAPVAEAPAIVPSTSLSNAFLTIRFNQPHVYYDDALTGAVQQAEKAKPGVVYDVLSTVPDLSVLPPDQQQKLKSRAQDNLRNVVIRLQQLGVPAARIRMAEQTLRIRSQEIQLFVR